MVIVTQGTRLRADLVSSQLWPWRMRARWMEAWPEVCVLCILLPVVPRGCTSPNWTRLCLVSLWWQSRVPLFSLVLELQGMYALPSSCSCLPDVAI